MIPPPLTQNPLWGVVLVRPAEVLHIHHGPHIVMHVARMRNCFNVRLEALPTLVILQSCIFQPAWHDFTPTPNKGRALETWPGLG